MESFYENHKPADFTEHHRFYLYRDFSFSALDHKMLTLIYQPMIGAIAASLYQLLYHQVAEGFTGYSPLEQQRKLFFGLGLEMNERGRMILAEQASILEAVGLLQTSRLEFPIKMMSCTSTVGCSAYACRVFSQSAFEYVASR